MNVDPIVNEGAPFDPRNYSLNENSVGPAVWKETLFESVTKYGDIVRIAATPRDTQPRGWGLGIAWRKDGEDKTEFDLFRRYLAIWELVGTLADSAAIDRAEWTLEAFLRSIPGFVKGHYKSWLGFDYESQEGPSR